MTIKISTAENEFEKKFNEFLSIDRSASINVKDDVLNIVEKIKLQGDKALISFTNKFDKNNLTLSELLVSEDEINRLIKDLPQEIKDAIDLAYNRIESFHKKQIPEDLSYLDDAKIELGYIWKPLGSVGIYVPGGSASYPSSVLMNAVPAKVAGVSNITMTSPSVEGQINPSVLYAAKKVGINKVYRVGGAQAIAALAFGTETISCVDKIVGPGNIYVSEAKKQVFGSVGIDMIAGPSEVVIIADSNNDPEIIAADLIAQAEHDVSSQSILITNDKSLAEKVSNSVDDQLLSLPRKDIASKSWNANGAIILSASVEESINLSNQIAPEHLEIFTENAKSYLNQVKNAGAIFLGSNSPEAIGDYIAGPSHVLPTSRSARYSSGLSVFDFVKKTSVIECTGEGLKEIGGHAISFAKNEGLDGHARSIEYRLSKK